nr:reverse transcriptase domain-containing protein [Tanacetum cinerariifolium]
MAEVRDEAKKKYTEATGIVFDGENYSLLTSYEPNWMRDDRWQDLINRVWNSPKWREKSRKASQNRNTQADGSVGKHMCGSVTMTQHKLNKEKFEKLDSNVKLMMAMKSMSVVKIDLDERLSLDYGSGTSVPAAETTFVESPSVGRTQTTGRADHGPELNYSPMEKLVLSLVFAAKRLRRYFQAHPITVITDQPIKQVMSRPDVAGRLQKWRIMLGEHNITYRPRTSIKGQILADFLNEMPSNALQGVSVAETKEEPWTLFTDGSSCVDGSGAWLILTNPDGVEFTYALRFQFAALNNEAEYEALIAGLRIATQMGVKNIQANVDSKLVANQVLGTYVAKEENMIKYLDIAKGLVLVEVLETKSITRKEVTTVIEEEGPTWMMELVNYLKEGILPGDEKEARKLCIKARQYELMEGILYKQSFLTPWLRCVGPLQAEYVMKEIHEGSCSMHAGPRTFSGRVGESQVPDSRNGLLHEVDRSKGGSNDYRRTVIPAEIGMPTYRITAVDVVNNDEELRLNLDLLEERQELTAMSEARSKSKMMKYYNFRVRSVAFKPGDFVYRSNDASHAVAGGKLGPKWEGPYEVTDALGNGAYKLRSTNGTMLPRTWNVTNLKQCYL